MLALLLPLVTSMGSWSSELQPIALPVVEVEVLDPGRTPRHAFRLSPEVGMRQTDTAEGWLQDLGEGYRGVVELEVVGVGETILYRVEQTSFEASVHSQHLTGLVCEVEVDRSGCTVRAACTPMTEESAPFLSEHLRGMVMRTPCQPEQELGDGAILRVVSRSREHDHDRESVSICHSSQRDGEAFGLTCSATYTRTPMPGASQPPMRGTGVWTGRYTAEMLVPLEGRRITANIYDFDGVRALRRSSLETTSELRRAP